MPAGECSAKWGIRCGDVPQTPSASNRRKVKARFARPRYRDAATTPQPSNRDGSPPIRSTAANTATTPTIVCSSE